ncbi:DUF3168 domain-containing protein [Shinella fusca]|uniref:DUF3168 domain-containing protein n=1 Tax=Shinella fusca TaxID=544480 RepID=A0A7W7YTF9_9HYPH|nr:DUF3168 domain-containing protein [Shinella fusca]MBB5041932.1 hypothetical protein [Shinella fusca]
MADPVFELQGAIITRLRATPAVTALVPAERIRDIPNATWTNVDYISVGPSNFMPDDYDCVDGGEVMIQFDCWSVTGLATVRAIADALRVATRDWVPALATNRVVSFSHWRTDYIRNPPINQASVRFTAIIDAI